MPWQVLAAINEIETDYGRNLSVSTAGAVGWMQFMPATWKIYGVDANGDGKADPYNPVDAIFTAARYLNAAGASKNLGLAIFAYNHADLVRPVGAAARQADRRPARASSSTRSPAWSRATSPSPRRPSTPTAPCSRWPRRKVKTSNAAVPVSSDSSSTKVVDLRQAGLPRDRGQRRQDRRRRRHERRVG